MSSANRPAVASSTANAPPAGEKSFFEQQRDGLLAEIGISFEHVLQNINKLNRSLEGVIAVGNEFSAVEALWSQFETVMGREPEVPEAAQEERSEGEGEGEEETEVGEGESVVEQTEGGLEGRGAKS